MVPFELAPRLIGSQKVRRWVPGSRQHWPPYAHYNMPLQIRDGTSSNSLLFEPIHLVSAGGLGDTKPESDATAKRDGD